MNGTQIVSVVSLDDLLAALLAAFPSTNDNSFVVCAHGNKDGMTMPVVHSSPKFAANTTTLKFLMQSNVTSLTPTAPAGVVPPTKQQVADLVSKMQAVRKLQINYVEFRGCAIGMNYDNLEAMREFLGCTTVSGFDVKSDWAAVTRTSSRPKSLISEKKNPNAQVGQFPPGRCGIYVDWGVRKVFFVSESNAAVAFWLAAHIPKFPEFPPTPPFEGWMGHFSLHGLHTNPHVLPLDAGYVSHLKHVIYTPTGLVKT